MEIVAEKPVKNQQRVVWKWKGHTYLPYLHFRRPPNAPHTFGRGLDWRNLCRGAARKRRSRMHFIRRVCKRLDVLKAFDTFFAREKRRGAKAFEALWRAYRAAAMIARRKMQLRGETN